MLLCVPNGLNIITITAGVLTTGTAFSGIIWGEDMDRELNNKIIGYIIYIDKFLREKEESGYKVKKGFP